MSMLAQRWPPNGQPKWRTAYECASGVYESLRNAPVTALEDRMALDFAAVVLNAIISIETDKKINANCFARIAKYLSPESKTPLLKVGYSLNVLLEKLMADRIAAPTAFVLKQMPSTSNGVATGRCEVSLRLEDATSKEEFIDEPEVIKPGPMDTKPDEKEIKIELDDDLVLPKEEPLADVFCPATGESRPVDSSNDFRNEYSEMVQAQNEQQTWQCEPSTSSGMARGGTCFLCNKLPDKFYSTPSNPVLRQAFLNRVIKIAREDLDNLFYLKKGNEVAYFCPEHVVSRPPPEIVEKIMKKPRNDSHICQLCGEKAGFPYLVSPKEEAEARTFFSNLVELSADQLKLVDYYKDSKTQIIICKRHYRTNLIRTADVLVAPVRRTALTPASKFVPQSAQATRNLLTEPLRNPYEDQVVPMTRFRKASEWAKTLPPKKKLVMLPSRQHRICDLCGIMTTAHMTSPKDRAMAHYFFSNLVGLTPEQRLRAEKFQRRGEATICKKHYAVPVTLKKTQQKEVVDTMKDAEVKQEEDSQAITRKRKIPDSDDDDIDAQFYDDYDEPGTSGTH